MVINFKPHKKQYEAWEYLNDDVTTEILWGGGASGGKTYFGCAWLIISCLKYPKSRWLMGRSKLNSLKNTTLKTFNDILGDWGISDRFKINFQTNTIYCDNGSEILMKDLFAYPSDPDFDSLGSLEITGSFIDEASQISYKAFEMVQTRIRYKLKEFGIKPKLLMTCNPSKGFLYTEFYKPYIDGTLKPYRKFIPALATDNPNTEPSYIENLQKASNSVRQRLLLGNWDYSDDIDSLFRYENLVCMTDLNYIPSSNRYITADIARLGKDRTLIMVWDDLVVIEMIELNQMTTDISAQKIKELSLSYNIPLHNIIIDADGIGGGVVDQISGVRSFINNSRPLEVVGSPNIYQNLKSQCYYKLAEFIEQKKVKIKSINSEEFELLCQELQVMKQKDIDSDGKLAVTSKDVVKKILGRSPDYADCIMMRMYWEMKPKYRKIQLF